MNCRIVLWKIGITHLHRHLLESRPPQTLISAQTLVTLTFTSSTKTLPEEKTGNPESSLNKFPWAGLECQGGASWWGPELYTQILPAPPPAVIAPHSLPLMRSFSEALGELFGASCSREIEVSMGACESHPILISWWWINIRRETYGVYSPQC